MKRLLIISISMIVLSLQNISCGYRVGSILPLDIHSIAIPTFKNLTQKPGIETSITNKIIERFQIDGTLRVIEQKDADVLLTGELVDYRREPVRFSGEDYSDVREYRLTIVCKVSLINLVTQEEIWKDRLIEGETTYKTGGDLSERELTAIGTTLTSEKAQLPTLEEDLAYNVVESVVEGW
ncbi:LptE family protein [Chlamydiota bacterium]